MPSALYIFWILHQTTTAVKQVPFSYCCISFESYIKPQLDAYKERQNRVVYLLNPTSNHNPIEVPHWKDEVVYLLNPTSNHNFVLIIHILVKLYIFWILHQTTTVKEHWKYNEELYIFWILHQTTTCPYNPTSGCRCISFESYIKPQPFAWSFLRVGVVYLLNPTSNHNAVALKRTQNRLYIFWILHQTTTLPASRRSTDGCISFESYIKPQPGLPAEMIEKVVYLLNPTSNHNVPAVPIIRTLLYIFWILHQTTTDFARY